MKLQFNPKLAKHLENDLAAATIFESIKHWVDFNSRNERNFRNGHFWTYNTIEEWAKQLVFCTPKLFYKKISKLRKAGLIYTEKFNKEKGDHTLWYRINYQLYEEIIGECQCFDGHKNNYTSNTHTDQENNTNDDTDFPTLNSEKKIDNDYPTEEKPIIVTINNNNKKEKKKFKKEEGGRRGWYIQPQYEDFGTWTPPDKLHKAIKYKYDLTDEEIGNALTEFVLYNKAKGTKFKFLDPIFELWCKRYKRFKRVIKSGLKKSAKVVYDTVDTIEQGIISTIQYLKDSYSQSIFHILLKHFGAIKYREMKLSYFQLKAPEESSKNTLEFIGLTPFMLEEAWILRRYKNEINEALGIAGYNYDKILICDG
jgi:hypothetical protein